MPQGIVYSITSNGMGSIFEGSKEDLEKWQKSRELENEDDDFDFIIYDFDYNDIIEGRENIDVHAKVEYEVTEIGEVVKIKVLK